MGRDVERRLRERLARVEALHAGATTPGERAAAQKALERVVEKLGEVMAKDEVRRFVWAHVASLGVPEPQHVRRERGMPTAAEVARALARWQRGDWGPREVHRWACRIVDAVVLPHHPDHERLETPIVATACMCTAMHGARASRQQCPSRPHSRKLHRC